jgi:hypothetical protein
MNSKMIIYVTGILVFFTVIIIACEKEKKTNAPELPPLSTLSIQLGDFSVTEKAAGTYNNIITAALTTGYWNTVLTAYMAVPVASYAEAFHHQAQRLDNNTWEWTYEVVIQDTTYTANLFAFIESDAINMEMHISKEGGFQDFVWYTGTFNLQRTEGQWTIQDNPENDISWLSIIWHHDYEAGTFDALYKNVYPTGEYKDSFIKYGIRKDNAYDAFYNIYSSPDDKNYDIDFNTTTHEGRIFYESLWHCWDANLQDAVCQN